MHEILLLACNFPTPFEASLFECLYDQSVRLQAIRVITRTPRARAQQPALWPELDTVAIQPVMVGIDIDRDPERMIAETAAITLRIDISARPSHTVTDNRIDFFALPDKLAQYVLNNCRILPAHRKFRQSFQSDRLLILGTNRATALYVQFIRQEL